MNRAFRTDADRTVQSVSPFTMAELDRVAIDETGPNLFQMMENAGRNMAEHIIERRPADELVMVLAGVGGNGGGGICAARHLANHGRRVELVVLRPADLREVPAVQLKIYQGTDAPLVSVADALSRITELAIGQITIVDAILGYRGRPVLTGPERDIVETVNTRSPATHVIALDVATGFDPETGERGDTALIPSTVLTLALPKTGLHVFTGRSYRNTEIVLADIGIPNAAYKAVGYARPFSGRYRIPLRAID